MTIDPNAFLMGSGVKSAAFPTIGTVVSGRVVRDPEVRQQTDFDDGKPKFFDNGDPMMQLIVQIATDQRDPQDIEDDGVRSLYVKGLMLIAVRDAVRKSGAKGLEVGGTITVTFTGDGENKRGRGLPPKAYAAAYQPPAAQAANAVLMGNGNGQAQQPPPVPAAQPAPVGSPPPGIDPNLWAQMTTEQRASVLAVTANVG